MKRKLTMAMFVQESESKKYQPFCFRFITNQQLYEVLYKPEPPKEVPEVDDREWDFWHSLGAVG